MFDFFHNDEFNESDESEAPRRRRPTAPKPVEFQVAELQAGKKARAAGGFGGMVTFKDGFAMNMKEVQQKEIVLLGKVLFGRQRFAFEVQELNRRPADVRRILKKAKEMEEARFGPLDDFGFGEAREAKEKTDEVAWMDVWKAEELTAKHSIQVKFQDIERVDVIDDEVTLILSKGPQCYVKPEGEMAIVNMEVAKDITGGARSIKFKTTDSTAQQEQLCFRSSKELMSFSKVRHMVSEHSSHMDALFRGQVPVKPVPTPSRKRKADDAGAVKKPRMDPSKLLEDITAAPGSWLQQAVEQFQLKGICDRNIPDSQWKRYVEERELLESFDQDDHEGEEEEEFEEDEEVDADKKASRILCSIRESVAATMNSSALKVDAEAFARGVFILSNDSDDYDEVEEPRRVSIHARIYAPNATGNFVDLWYTNHHRERMSFTERFSHLFASCGGPFMKVVHPEGPKGKKKCEKIFDLDYNEHRRKNPVKQSLASNATLCQLGIHLFGSEALSNRKVFMLLVRSVGLGKWGEVNGWPIAMARQRFKRRKDESDTDVEAITGEQIKEANVGDCCVM
ncbi:unnamed protein product [Durusdinium trenchii]|uniref:Uncharacterized protein n=1 Tax=Durusdinium trenchii TaxID=1381693 RepID=A0ABP0QFL6_9DINO